MLEYRITNYPFRVLFRRGCLCYLFLVFYFGAESQNCPENIDFEKGDFSGWTCFFGYTFGTPDTNAIVLYNSGVLYDHHAIIPANNVALDPYGKFPVVCPNGSGYSIKLGTTERGGEAEGISYDFIIPPDRNDFTLTYHYAVVLQSPHHMITEQPRMVIDVTNVTDNEKIDCASFTFIAVGTSLPGFELSSYQPDTTAVLFKNWTTVSVDLSGLAGKAIRLFFKTADCTLSEHFGYAYIDVDSQCDGSFVGAKYCPDDTLVNVVAPFGYKNYTWFDSSLNSILGKDQQISLPPLALSGQTVAVKLEPYEGFGCPKTLFAKLEDSLNVHSNAGPDTFSCTANPARLGQTPIPGLSYRWEPAAGLSDPFVANPLASPDTSTNYVLTTSNSGGGCPAKDTVFVQAYPIDTSLHINGDSILCLGSGTNPQLEVHPEKKIQWFKDSTQLPGEIFINYSPTESGIYQAVLENEVGCRVFTRAQTIWVDTPKAGIMYPVKYAILNQPLQLEARLIGNTVTWNPANNLTDAVSFNPVFQGNADQEFLITITSPAGCITKDTQLVQAIRAVEIWIPNAFTPNNDGRNDLLRPILRGIRKFNYFKIYDRLGNLVFLSNKSEKGWDGSLKGEPIGSQVLVWVLSCEGGDGVSYFRKGSVILIR